MGSRAVQPLSAVAVTRSTCPPAIRYCDRNSRATRSIFISPGRDLAEECDCAALHCTCAQVCGKHFFALSVSVPKSRNPRLSASQPQHTLLASHTETAGHGVPLEKRVTIVTVAAGRPPQCRLLFAAASVSAIASASTSCVCVCVCVCSSCDSVGGAPAAMTVAVAQGCGNEKG